MDICMVGTGYVGLVTGTCFAQMGHNVICVDSNKEKIETLKKGECPIYEPGLQELIVKNRKAGRLRFTTNIAEGVKSSSVILVGLGIPFLATTDFLAIGRISRAAIFLPSSVIR